MVVAQRSMQYARDGQPVKSHISYVVLTQSVASYTWAHMKIPPSLPHSNIPLLK